MKNEEKLAPGPTSDEEIIVLALKTPSKFKVLLDRHEAAFLRYAKRYLDADDADDAVAETFIKVYLHASQFASFGAGSFRAWAYRILKNTVVSMARAERRRGVVVPLGSVAEVLSDARAVSEEGMGWRDYVARVLYRLPRQLSSVLRRRFFSGESYAEIAAAEGISLGAVKMRLHRAKQEFKRLSYEFCPHEF